MKTPIEWLRQYAPVTEGIDGIKEKMMWMGFSTESVENLGEEIQNVVVGRVESITKHPNADSLFVCQVNAGGPSTVQIVTGATNVNAGDYVPVALHGARLPGGKRINKGKLRGEESYGMLCSGAELNVSADLYPGADVDGILILKEEYEPGTDVCEIFGFDTPVFDFEILANRPDCLSLLGLAREASVAMNAPFYEPEISVKEKGSGAAAQRVSVSIEAPELCQRYAARIVENIRIAPSPLWMRKRLTQAGIRPHNNIVDITNYVMLEQGHPMHAFDFAAVSGGKIVVRKARAGETLRTLDEADRTLSTEMLVIADAEKPSALGGVMGGESSQITPQTRTVLLECARFLPKCIRATSRGLGLRSESSMRFEKGVSEYTIIKAINRAAQLIEELDAGDVVPGVVDVWPEPKQCAEITCTCDQIRGRIGVDISDERMAEILCELGMNAKLSGGRITCQAPVWRQDITQWVDLAEEVLRVYGYPHIKATLPRGAVQQGKRSAGVVARSALKQSLVGRGLHEIITYSFISPKAFTMLGLPEGDALRHSARILNPLGEDYSLMRTTLSHSMLETLALNQSRGNVPAYLFEVGARFLPAELPLKELPQERQTLCVGLIGPQADFFMVKALAETLFVQGHVHDVRWLPQGPCYMHPGRVATVFAGDECLGYVGELHPDVAERYGLRGRIALAEIYLDTLAANEQPMKGVAPLPKYPAVTRDIALVVEDSVPVGELMRTLRLAGAPLLENVTLFDVYRSEAIGQSKKSVAYALAFRAADRTLTDAEVASSLDAMLTAAGTAYGAVLRA